MNNKNYEVAARAGDTEATLLDRWIALVQADLDAPVTATAVQDAGTTVGVLLTGKNLNTFSVTLDGLFRYATKHEGPAVAATRNVNLGRGTAAQVAAIELASDANDGKAGTAGQTHYYWKRGSAVESGVNYNIFNFQWKTEAPFMNFPAGGNVATPELVIAIQNGSALDTAFTTIVTNVFLSRSTEGGGVAKKA